MVWRETRGKSETVSADGGSGICRATLYMARKREEGHDAISGGRAGLHNWTFVRHGRRAGK